MFLKIAKIIPYTVKVDFFCYWNVIITSGTRKLENKQKINGRFCGKITKNYVFPTSDEKKQLGVNQCSKIMYW